MRGLPHTHNVFWFQYDDKIKTEADIDNKIKYQIKTKILFCTKLVSVMLEKHVLLLDLYKRISLAF